MILDHYSRRVMGVAAFRKQPSSKVIQGLLVQIGSPPKHLICDKGRQFWTVGFKRGCKRRQISLRFGAIGKHGSMVVNERLILTLKQHIRRCPLVPLQLTVFQEHILALAEWYNEHRPHSALKGLTPNEVVSIALIP